MPDKPKIVAFHGSHHDFDQFDPNRIGATDEGYYGKGFYLSPNEEDARDYGPVKKWELELKNPFVIPSSGSVGHDSLFDLRDKLAALEGGPKHLKTNREIPVGYTLKESTSEHYGKSYPTYSVEPLHRLYGTDKEVYGPERSSPLAAVVHFNDQQSGLGNIDHSWASGLLRHETDRDRLHELLQKNGHDGIVVRDPDDGRDKEYVAFQPNQLKKLSRYHIAEILVKMYRNSQNSTASKKTNIFQDSQNLHVANTVPLWYKGLIVGHFLG